MRKVCVHSPGCPLTNTTLPAVMCFIYGGSLNNGSTDRWWYDPTEWIRAQEAAGQPVIVVSGSYRTNIFGACAQNALLHTLIAACSRTGFFSGPDVLAADPDGLSGNYGLYDCVSMLEWVRLYTRSPVVSLTVTTLAHAGSKQHCAIRRRREQRNTLWAISWRFLGRQSASDGQKAFPTRNSSQWRGRNNGELVHRPFSGG